MNFVLHDVDKKLTTLDLECCKRAEKLSVSTILDMSVYFPVLETLLFQDLSYGSSVQQLRRRFQRLILLDYDIIIAFNVAINILITCSSRITPK
ncbi:hypothetical protein GQX74_002500 [Glossina fuscipes]|nr:hypothetical protein GQX74_002500 [Glossina fuscipes]